MLVVVLELPYKNYAIYNGDVIDNDQVLLITDASIVVFLTLFIREVVYQNAFTIGKKEIQTISKIPQNHGVTFSEQELATKQSLKRNGLFTQNLPTRA